MIHEWRSYVLKPGTAADYLALFAEEGLPLVTRHLPLTGYWLGETGALNTLHHLWSYADWTEREACRASLATEEAWVKGFIPKAFALVETQENRLLRTSATSSVFERALARRREPRAARAKAEPLFAPDCAALVRGHSVEEAVAVWTVISRRAAGPFSLLPRRADPVPAGDIGGEHIVLRPLAFSPL